MASNAPNNDPFVAEQPPFIRRLDAALGGAGADRAGWVLWAVIAAALAIIITAAPGKRTVFEAYAVGSQRFEARQPLYDSDVFGGFVYSPAFAAMFVPFEAVPRAMGESVWRWTNVAVFALALFRLARHVLRPGWPRLFLAMSLLCLPASLAALRNGQLNTMLAGCLIHAALDIASGRRWGASGWLSLAIVLKPIGVVPALLACATFPGLIPRVAVLTGALLALPLLAAPADYVVEQYRLFAHYLTDRAADRIGTPDNRFADLRGGLLAMGIETPAGPWKFVRAGLALATLAWWWLAARRLPIREAVLWLVALSAAYLMLCNPANERNSYILLAPAIACWGVTRLHEPGARAVGASCIGLCLLFGLPALGGPVYRATAGWIPPLIAVVFVTILAFEFVRLSRARGPRDHDPAAVSAGGG